MKNSYKYLIRVSFILSLVVFISCEDEDSIRIPDTDPVTDFRVVRDVSSFDSTDPNAAVNLTIYSESNNIQDVAMFVSHYILITNSESGQYPLATLSGNQITNDGSLQLDFTLNELTAAMNKTPADLAGGDAVNIYSIVTLTDGRVYPDTVKANADNIFINVTPNIVNSSATTSFSPKLIFPIICDMDPSFGTGTYLFEVIETIPGGNTGFGVPIFDWSATVEITATSNIGRTFDVGYFTAFGFPPTAFNFDFACNVTLLAPTGAGLGCGGGGLAWDLNLDDPGQFDISDDSQFTISVVNNIFADCGIPVNEPMKFRLTKQ